MIGPGKYDDEAALVMLRNQAKGVFLIVIEGREGSGVSNKVFPTHAHMVPPMLRAIADEMERDHRHMGR